MDIELYIGICIISQCTFTIAYLMSFGWQRNRWLALSFLSILLMHVGLLTTPRDLTWEKLFIGNPGFTLLIWPSLFFYTKALLQLEMNKIILHFLPFFVYYLLFLSIEIDPPDEFIATLSTGKMLPIQLTHFAVLILTTVYYGRAIPRIIELQQAEFNPSVNRQGELYQNLNWLKYLCWLIFGIVIFGSGGLLLSNFSTRFAVPFWLIEILFLICCTLISVFAFRQPDLLLAKNDIESWRKEEFENF